MANRERGEIEIQGQDAAGAPKAYTLVITLNAMCELEERTNTPFQVFVVSLGTMAKIRQLFWCATREHHPELDEKAVGRLMQGIGGVKAIGKVMEDLMRAANPDAADLKEVPDRPPTAQAEGPAGTGDTSTPKPGASA